MKSVQDLLVAKDRRTIGRSYPLGIPNNGSGLHFRLDLTLDWIVDTVSNSPWPFFAYFHLFPPHFPYCPTIEYFDAFDDGWAPRTKPASNFSEGRSIQFLNEKRQRFDEYLLYIDAEFGRFMDNLRRKGVLENSIILLTSDHGQMFERGIWAHMTPVLFEPLLRVPLLVWDPNRPDGGEVEEVTSAVDLLPTIARMVGQELPSWCEGDILPPYRLTPGRRDRRIFAIEAKSNAKLNPLVKGSISSVGQRYKLVRYFGYEGFADEYLMFDLQNDPAETESIYSGQSSIAQDLRDQLLNRIEGENRDLRDRTHP
jgi:arylsulfatase A-like enzyme